MWCVFELLSRLLEDNRVSPLVSTSSLMLSAEGIRRDLAGCLRTNDQLQAHSESTLSY